MEHHSPALCATHPMTVACVYAAEDYEPGAPEGIPVSVEITPRGQRLIDAQAREAAYDAAIDYARNLGAEHGRNAAEWYVQDAFTNAVFDHDGNRRIRAILRGIADGDPEVLDTFPAPDLSGEWADTLTGPALMRDAADAAHRMTGHYPHVDDWYSDVCDAYESAFSDAVADAIETAARAVLA